MDTLAQFMTKLGSAAADPANRRQSVPILQALDACRAGDMEMVASILEDNYFYDLAEVARSLARA